MKSNPKHIFSTPSEELLWKIKKCIVVLAKAVEYNYHALSSALAYGPGPIGGETIESIVRNHPECHEALVEIGLKCLTCKHLLHFNEKGIMNCRYYKNIDMLNVSKCPYYETLGDEK